MQELPPIPFDDDIPDDDISASLDDFGRLTHLDHTIPDSDKFAQRLSRASDTKLIIRGCGLLIGSGPFGAAASIPKSLPVGSVSLPVIVNAVQQLPKGALLSIGTSLWFSPTQC
jgi:hypothetical protein